MTRYTLAALIAVVCAVGCESGGRRSDSPSGALASEREEKPDAPLEAAWFRYQRNLDASGAWPDGALLRAKGQRDAMLDGLGPRGGPDGPTWTWIGPGNIGGRLRGILIHPGDPDTLWVGAASGGVWKTTNGGATWAPLDDFLPSLAIGCMVMHPTDPDTLLAGTGEGFFETVEGSSNTAAVRGAGIFKSTDGGATWAQMPSTSGPDWYFVNRLAVHPNDVQLILAATQAGIYRSTNGGETWTKVRDGVTYDLQIHPTDTSKVVAGPHDGPPLYSTDGGQSWNSATGAAGLSGHRVEIRYARNSPEIVYAAVSGDDGRIKIWRSADGGQTYVLRTSGAGYSTYAAYNNVLWVDPTNSNTLILGAVELFRSTNGGSSFSTVFGAAHLDHHVIAESPGFDGVNNRIVYFGTDGGIYRTDNVYGSTVVELNNNLGVTQFYGAAVNDASGVVVAGAQDNGTTRYSGNPEGWTSVIGGDGGYCASDPSDPNYFYGETQYLAIRRSSNGGSNYTSIYQGISDAGGLLTNFIPYFMLDPNNPNRMLAAARRLWRSNNVKSGTVTWAAIKPTIEPPGPAPTPDPDTDQAHFAPNSPYNISTIAVAEGDSDIVWVGYNNGEVWKTLDGTATTPSWTRVDANGVGLPDRWISRIVINRANHNDVYVAIMGWNADNVWRTTNGGATWSDISGSGVSGLPDAPVSALAQHRARPSRLYAGTEIGVFVSHNYGQHWFPLTQGPNTAPVEELIWRNDSTLMAVTHGRGIYFGAIAAPPDTGDMNCDGSLNGQDIGAFVAALNDPVTYGEDYPDCDIYSADINGDGSINGFDIGGFITCLLNGECP